MLFIFPMSILTADSFDDFDLLNDTDGDSQRSVYDPFSRYNRLMFSFNLSVYKVIVRPIVNTYKLLTPYAFRYGVKNAYHNILFPIRFVNNVLQFKFHDSGIETLRFLTNSTIGCLGTLDIAKAHFKLYPKNEDFGQTLGYWGVSSGPYIVLPFLGPSNLRDLTGMVTDIAINPLRVYGSDTRNLVYENTPFMVTTQINALSFQQVQMDQLLSDSIDSYSFVRRAYTDNRKNDISK